MKTRIITTVAVAGDLAALATSDVFAAGRGNGGSKGQSNGKVLSPYCLGPGLTGNNNGLP